MTIQSLSSAYIQKNFGAVIDSVLSGTAAIIERYGRKLAVIISHKEYERLKRAEAALIDKRFEQLETEKGGVTFASFDELKEAIDAD